RPGKSPLRGALSLFLAAIGSGAILHPCRSHPLGASLRLDPASRKRFGDFQPDSRSLNLFSRLHVAPVWVPAEIGEPAARGETRQDKIAGSNFEQRLRWPRRGESHGWDE
ncbi:MAG TPA: hypothetical protein VGN40_20800, partial [Lelliottia sp.]